MRNFFSIIMNNFIYYLILIPCILVIISLLYQKMTFPDNIPDIFGWKGFIVQTDNVVDEIKKGDLIFVKNIDVEELNENDIVACRKNSKKVTINKILQIDRRLNNDSVAFKVQNSNDDSIINVTDSNIEGIYKFRIPKVGALLYLIIQPPILLSCFAVIVIIEAIWIYLAGKSDKRNIEMLKIWYL